MEEKAKDPTKCLVCKQNEAVSDAFQLCSSCLQAIKESVVPIIGSLLIETIKKAELAENVKEDPIQKDFLSEIKEIVPLELFKDLNEIIIGQNEAINKLVSSISLHVFSIKDPTVSIENKKFNILLFGSTGVGKTFSIKTLAKLLKIPIGFLNCANVTPPGFVGVDIETGLWDLFKRSGKNKEIAENGILFLDEVDKIGVKKNVDFSDHSNKGKYNIQQALLRILEGDKVKIYPSGAFKGGDPSEGVELDTSKILFIGAGTFDGLKKIAQRREKKSRNFDEFSLGEITDEDLISFGFIPEFASRFQTRIKYKNLDFDDIMTLINSENEENSPLAVFKAYFNKRGTNLEITNEVKIRLAKFAMNNGNGARAIFGVLYNWLQPAIFNPEEYTEGKVLLIDNVYLNKD